MNTGIKIKINVNWWPMGRSKFQENHNTNMPVATRGKKIFRTLSKTLREKYAGKCSGYYSYFCLMGSFVLKVILSLHVAKWKHRAVG